MTGMLASVTSVAEAEIVLQAGVDIVDIKNPMTGALGAQPLDTVQAIVKHVAAAIPTSATIGDIAPDDPALLSRIEKMADTGVDIVKVGLFGQQADAGFLDRVTRVANNNIALVVVLFAEYYPFDAYLPALLDTGIHGVMIDTCSKNGPSLRGHLSEPVLHTFVQSAQANGLIAGLAGSLCYADIQPLLGIKPDYLGFRGALCRDNHRTNQLDPGLVNKIRETVQNSSDFRYDDFNIQQASL